MFTITLATEIATNVIKREQLTTIDTTTLAITYVTYAATKEPFLSTFTAIG
jgi:hypothetical protein